MYKIILALLVVLFIFGCSGGYTDNVVVCNKPYIKVGNDCCLDRNDNSICDKDEVVNTDVDKLEEGNVVGLPEEKEEPVRKEVEKEEPEKLEPEKVVLMKEGDSVIFNGKQISLEKIDLTSGVLEFIIDVEGVTRSLYSTRDMEIVNGVKVTALTIDNLKRTIEIKFEMLELEPNEYLIYTNKNIFVDGKEIKLRDVNSDEYILIDIIDGTLKTSIKEGKSKIIDGLEITNVNAFFRDSLSERYAIIKVTKSS
jgi:hypothetical protein